MRKCRKNYKFDIVVTILAILITSLYIFIAILCDHMLPLIGDEKAGLCRSLPCFVLCFTDSSPGCPKFGFFLVCTNRMFFVAVESSHLVCSAAMSGMGIAYFVRMQKGSKCGERERKKR